MRLLNVRYLFTIRRHPCRLTAAPGVHAATLWQSPALGGEPPRGAAASPQRGALRHPAALPGPASAGRLRRSRRGKGGKGCVEMAAGTIADAFAAVAANAAGVGGMGMVAAADPSSLSQSELDHMDSLEVENSGEIEMNGIMYLLRPSNLLSDLATHPAASC